MYLVSSMKVMYLYKVYLCLRHIKVGLVTMSIERVLPFPLRRVLQFNTGLVPRVTLISIVLTT
jgi:hypothetical protein